MKASLHPRLPAFLLIALVVAAGGWFTWNSEAVERWRIQRMDTAALEALVRKQPGAAWPTYELGVRYAGQNRLPEAMDLFERSAALLPKKHEPQLSLGLGFLKLGAAPPAAEAFRRAAELAPRNPRIPMYRSAALRSSSRFKEAEEEARRALALQPDLAEAWFELGMVLYRPGGKQGEGRGALGKAAAGAPQNGMFQREYGSALSDAGDFAAAERHLREAVKLLPNDYGAHMLLGRTLRRAGDAGQQAEAERELRESVRLNPDVPQPYYELGILLEEQGRSKDALAAFRECVRRDPAYAESWLHLAGVAERSGLAKDAARARARYRDLTRDRDRLQYVERRLADAPEDTQLRFEWATLLEKAGRWREAGGQYLRILKQEPKHRRAQAALDRLDRWVRRTQPAAGGAAP